MARKLIVMLAAAVFTIMPLTANALGFGNIRVNSALNEQMDAEIDLLGATDSDIKDLEVKLASHNAFLRAGIERSAPLLGLRFSVNQRSNGTYYIKVVSRNTIREPFLNFLLEMNWKNGRMLREYTVLLDPPGRLQRQPTVVAAPETEAPSVVAEQEQVAEARQEPAFVPAPQPMIEPAPVVEAEPVVPVDDGQPFPRVELSEYKETDPQVTAMEKAVEAKPEPVMPPAPEPEPEAVLPELEPAQPMVEPEPVQPQPEMLEPKPEMVALPEDSGQPLEEQMEAPLFPTIPLSAYTDDASTDFTGRIAAEGEIMAEAEPMAAPAGELDYGITQKGDSLWRIAEKLRSNDSVTIHQVMMALLKSNPNAFINDNVHRLKVGQVLRIEDPSMLTAMNPQQAAQEYLAQTQAWEDYRQQVAAATETTLQPEMASDTGVISEAEPVVSEPTGELTLAAPESQELVAGVGTAEGEAAPSAMTDADLLREEVRKALEEAKTEQGRNTVLNERLRELEGELDTLQRSMTIQDDELAALQQQLSEMNRAAEQAAVEEPSEVSPVEEAPDLIAQAEPPAMEMTEQAPVEESMAEPMAETAPVDAEPAMQEETAAPRDLTAESGLAPTQTEAPVIPPAPPVPAEPGFMDKLVAMVGSVVAGAGGALSGVSGNPILLIGAGVAVIFLILLLILVKRRKSGTQFQESILRGGEEAAEAAPEMATAATAAEPASMDTNFSEESSFLSDFAISGAGAIQTEDSEVDPLTEADVFMAYGRHEAAEERLNEAIKQDPNRKELKLKLLELYNTTKNREAFEPLAEEFYASLGDEAATDPIWDKVLVMGAEIAPDNPLFSNVSASVAVNPAEEELSDISNASLSDSQVMDIGLDTGVFQTDDFQFEGAEEKSEEETGEEESSAALDFNLDFDTEEEKAEDLSEESTATFDFTEEQAEESTASLDFNLDMGEEEETATMQAPAAEQSEEDTASMDLDSALDFTLDTEEEGADEGTMTMEAPELAAADDSMTLEFDTAVPEEESSAAIDLNLDTEEASEEVSEPTMGDIEAGFALDDAELEAASSEESAGIDLNLDATDAAGLEDLGAVDEVGTKLDLAKAYIDMGDPEGARSILDEVMDEGNDSQKQEAQQLIQQIV